MNKFSADKGNFLYGFRKGLPIALGYIPVSFTFGLMAVNGGLSPLMAVFISLSNVTSAGQFAGTNLIFQGCSYMEITLTTFIINLRYMLMSLSLSQKIHPEVNTVQRLILGFGITDETFSVASMEEGLISYSYMTGLILGPIAGWTLGTAMGALICTALPVSIGSAMGIALYAMFIAIIVPPARKSGIIMRIVLISVGITLILRYIPLFSFITSGFRVIAATVLASAAGAILWPADKNAESDAKE